MFLFFSLLSICHISPASKQKHYPLSLSVHYVSDSFVLRCSFCIIFENLVEKRNKGDISAKKYISIRSRGQYF
jgi:hypothetical protein